MSDVNKIALRPDVESLMLANLIPIFQKENMEKFFKIFSSEIQELEQVFYDLLIGRRLETAIGAQLDEIGYKLKVYRNNATDDQFRNILKIRTLRRSNQGTQEDLLTMLRLFTGDVNVEILRVPPYGLTVTYNADCLAEGTGAEELLKFFPLVTRLILQRKNTNKPFGFADYNNLPTGTNGTMGSFASSTGLGNDADNNGSFTSLVYTPPDNV